MKRIYHVFLVLVVAVISFKCQKELSRNSTFPSQPTGQPSPIISTVQGNVVDENGQPAANVKISTGAKNAVTNSHGYFRITDAQLDKNASLVTAEQAGYFKAYRTFAATSGVNQVVIILIKKALTGTVNAITGGEVHLANGATVALPANGVTKSTGGAYTGAINIYAAYIDPTSENIGNTMPGSFMAEDAAKKIVVLSSFGMLAVELESSVGEKLQITPGSAATLYIPIPSSRLSPAPASISLWYVDEQTGIWIEQGTAKKNGNSYVGEVKHFSYWNADIKSPAIQFSAIFKTADNEPLTNMLVSVRPNEDSAGCAHGYTDSLGQVSGLIPANEKLVLQLSDQCGNVVYVKNIGPFSSGTDLGTITIPDAITSLITVKGKLLSCSNKPVSHGYAIIYFNNFVYNTGVNAKGEFSTNIFTCYGTSQTCEIIGVDETAQQQSTLLTVPLTAHLTDVGKIIACGTSSLQFIDYTLDGKDYTIANSVNDSLVAYSIAGAGASFGTYVQGHHSASNLLEFNFTGKAAAGIYSLNSLGVINYNNIVLTKPFNVTITTFPQHSGEFYEGSFSGSFKDNSTGTVTHSIDCTFRIKKY